MKSKHRHKWTKGQNWMRCEICNKVSFPNKDAGVKRKDKKGKAKGAFGGGKISLN